MKKYITRVLLFFVLVIFADIGVGILGDYMWTNSKGGYTKQSADFALNDIHDVLIFGSSRAKHHYDTPFLSDTLALNVYNAGADGSGIILATGLCELAISRYKPKLIIYDVTFSFDIIENPQDNNNVRYIKWLKPYYKSPAISSIIKDVKKEEWYKVHSGLIRYNSSLITMAQDYFISKELGNNGFEPMKGQLSELEVNMFSNKKEAIPSVDSLKLKYVEKFITLAQTNKIPIVFIKSPRLGAKDSDILQPVKDICSRYQVPFWDYRSNVLFQKPYFFCDHSHLNAEGARVFSRAVVEEILNKQLLKFK